MANIIVTGAKSLGSHLLRSAGRLAVNYAGQAAARAFDNRVFEGPRLDTLHIQSSRDGAPMPRIFGKARIAGQVIWAARLKEHVRDEQHGGKGGGPTSRTYSYTLSFAVGLCEGEILSVGRIWANGAPLKTAGLNMRIHTGSATQAPDPLIMTIDGPNVPAFRGTAYAVFEDMPLDDFGARLPQLNFEIIRALASDSENTGRLERNIQAVNLIPGSGEFAYDTHIAEERTGPGASRPINMNNQSGDADIDAALDQMQRELPNCRSVALVTSWFGDDLRMGNCQIRPGVETKSRTTLSRHWAVSGLNRSGAYLVSQINERPAYGGTPSDSSIIAAIAACKARGLKVSLYPFILMDIPDGNALPNPYQVGSTSQPVFPWRGRITCDPAPGQPGSAGKTAAAEAQMAAFFGQANPADFVFSGDTISYSGPEEFGLRRMALHYAHLAKAAGGIDSFIIASELRGVTTVRGASGDYPANAYLRTLAADVKSILGAGCKITYAADWSEYFGHQPQDGSGDVRYHLDPLWADPAIDEIGIDAYFPLSDWRSGDSHIDGQSFENRYSQAYLSANIEGGEGYDFYYANQADRDAQNRTPITDGLAGKPWVFRPKDVRAWWSNQHFDRIGGAELSVPTAWQPQSKPIRFTEIGCPAIDKGANQPNVFFDHKSSESELPYYSSGARDDVMQRAYLEAILDYWQPGSGKNPISNIYGQPMVSTDDIHIWCWDARPYPDFPARLDVWSDGLNWQRGHWLSGRTGLVSLAGIVSEICAASGLEFVDTSGLHGVVSGYMIDRPMSARAALSPLAAAYGFDLAEHGGQIRFIMAGFGPVTEIETQSLAFIDARPAFSQSRSDIAHTLKDVRLSFIDFGNDFQLGSEMAQGELAEAVHILDIGAPIVLDNSQAAQMAKAILSRAHGQSDTARFALAPALGALQSGDLVRIGTGGDIWQISALDGQGVRTAEARSISAQAPILSGGTPATPAPVPWVSAPDGFALDIASFGSGDRSGPVVGAIANPWAEIEMSYAGYQAILDRPVTIGALLTPLASGVVGRRDFQYSIDILIPNLTLSSVEMSALLSGSNMIALETPRGWEIIQAQKAELIGANTFRLSGLLRGQFGTDGLMQTNLPAGARCAYLGRGWENLPMDDDFTGQELTIDVSTHGRQPSAPAALVYRAAHLRPYAPCHLRARTENGQLDIGWVRRSRISGDAWSAGEIPLGEDIEAYEIDILSGGALISSLSSSGPHISVDRNTLPAGPLEIFIYQMSAQIGRGHGARIEAS